MTIAIISTTLDVKAIASAVNDAIAPRVHLPKRKIHHTHGDFIMQPIGYFCNNTHLMNAMEESWGSFFEALNNSERLWMLFSLIGNITADASENYDPSEIREYIVPAIDRLDELSFSDQLGLAQALIEQIKHYRHRG